MTEVQCVSLLIEETSANQWHAKIKHINPKEAEQRRERKEGWMDRQSSVPANLGGFGQTSGARQRLEASDWRRKGSGCGP